MLKEKKTQRSLWLYCRKCNYYKPYLSKNICPKCKGQMETKEFEERRIIDK